MKTKFNILLVITLFTITLFSSFAYANENTKHISIKEYERILKAEYAKYGVEMKVLDYDENKIHIIKKSMICFISKISCLTLIF